MEIGDPSIKRGPHTMMVGFEIMVLGSQYQEKCNRMTSIKIKGKSPGCFNVPGLVGS